MPIYRVKAGRRRDLDKVPTINVRVFIRQSAKTWDEYQQESFDKAVDAIEALVDAFRGDHEVIERDENNS